VSLSQFMEEHSDEFEIVDDSDDDDIEDELQTTRTLSC
jgi:hypothetical protein